MTNKTQDQINQMAEMIISSGNTCGTHLYALQDKNTSLILNYKNNSFYTTRQQAREARNQFLLSKRNRYTSSDVRVVTTDFVNVSPWRTVR